MMFTLSTIESLGTLDGYDLLNAAWVTTLWLGIPFVFSAITRGREPGLERTVVRGCVLGAPFVAGLALLGSVHGTPLIDMTKYQAEELALEGPVSSVEDPAVFADALELESTAPPAEPAGSIARVEAVSDVPDAAATNEETARVEGEPTVELEELAHGELDEEASFTANAGSEPPRSPSALIANDAAVDATADDAVAAFDSGGEVEGEAAPTDGSSESELATAATGFERAKEFVSSQAGGIALAIWALVALWGLRRLIRAKAGLERCRRAWHPVPAEFHRWVGSLGDQVGHNRPFETVHGPELNEAIASGWWRGLLALPSRWLHELERSALAPLILHELAHLRGRDPLWRALTWLASIALWPHPLIHLLARRESALSEIVADRHVLGTGADPRGYATTLGRLAHARAGVADPLALAPGIFGTRHSLEGRIRMILDSATPPRRRRLRPVAVVALTAAVLLVGLGIAHPLVGASANTNDDRDRTIAQLQDALDQRTVQLERANVQIAELRDQLAQLTVMLTRMESQREAERADREASRSRNTERDRRRTENAIRVAETKLNAAEQRLQIRQEQLARVQALQEAGTTTESEVHAARLDLAEARTSFEIARVELDNAKSEFTHLEENRARESAAAREREAALRLREAEADQKRRQLDEERLRERARKKQIKDLEQARETLELKLALTEQQAREYEAAAKAGHISKADLEREFARVADLRAQLAAEAAALEAQRRVLRVPAGDVHEHEPHDETRQPQGAHRHRSAAIELDRARALLAQQIAEFESQLRAIHQTADRGEYEKAKQQLRRAHQALEEFHAERGELHERMSTSLHERFSQRMLELERHRDQSERSRLQQLEQIEREFADREHALERRAETFEADLERKRQQLHREVEAMLEQRLRELEHRESDHRRELENYRRQLQREAEDMERALDQENESQGHRIETEMESLERELETLAKRIESAFESTEPQAERLHRHLEELHELILKRYEEGKKGKKGRARIEKAEGVDPESEGWKRAKKRKPPKVQSEPRDRTPEPLAEPAPPKPTATDPERVSAIKERAEVVKSQAREIDQVVSRLAEVARENPADANSEAVKAASEQVKRMREAVEAIKKEIEETSSPKSASQ